MPSIHSHCRPLVKDDQAFLFDMLYISHWDAPDDEPRADSLIQKPAIQGSVKDWGRPLPCDHLYSGNRWRIQYVGFSNHLLSF